MIFSHNFEIGVENANAFGEITNKFILQCLENVATLHAIKVGDENSGVREGDIGWVLMQWKMSVLRRPKYGEKITVQTWTRNNRQFLRDYEVYVGDELAVSASSRWILVDIKNVKILRFTPEYTDKYEPIDKTVPEENLKRLKELDDYSKSANFAIRKSDIDVNQHMHNLNYLDMAKEVISWDRELNNLEIAYKKQIKYGEKIKVFGAEQDGKFFVKVINSETGELKTLIELQ